MRADNFSLSSVAISPGFESVYKDDKGKYVLFPIVAATFQTYDMATEEDQESGDCLCVFPKLWDISRDEIDEVYADSTDFVGIKFPGETLEEFLQKIADEAKI